MNEVGNRMIVVSNQGERCRDCMLPIGVHFGKGRLFRVKSIAMDGIGHHLKLVNWHLCSHFSTILKAYLAKQEAEKQIFGNTPWHR